MFSCCASKKILTSVIKPSPAFKQSDPTETRHPRMVELLKAIEPLKKIKSNPLNDGSTKQTN